MNPHPLTHNIVNYYVSKIRNSSNNMHIDIERFNVALAAMVEEVLSLPLLFSNDDRAFEIAIQSLDLFRLAVVDAQTRANENRPLSYSQKAGLATSAIKSALGNSLLYDVAKLPESLNLT
ncbi:hypothetical protein ACOCGN_001717 [Vibrio cholerae]